MTDTQKDIYANFDAVYDAKIKPKLQNMENFRLECKRQHDIWGLIAFITTGISILALYLAGKFANAYALILIVSVPVFVFGATKLKQTELYFRKTIKENLLVPIFSLFVKFKISQTEMISLKEIKENGLFHDARYKKDDDNIAGTYKDIPVYLCETRLWHVKEDRNGKSKPEQIEDFNGLILKIKMNKNFEGSTVVRQRPSYDYLVNIVKELQKKYPALISDKIISFLTSPMVRTYGNLRAKGVSIGLNSISITTKINPKPRKLEKVTLEDVEFNNFFDVFSDSQIESRYLLTTSFMERIKTIQAVFLALGVNCVFKDDYIYIFLNHCINIGSVTSGRGLFEVGGMNSTLLDKNIYKMVFNQLVSIFQLIQHFKLDQKIGM